jgi:hypothetical protein
MAVAATNVTVDVHLAIALGGPVAECLFRRSLPFVDIVDDGDCREIEEILSRVPEALQQRLFMMVYGAVEKALSAHWSEVRTLANRLNETDGVVRAQEILECCPQAAALGGLECQPIQ